MRPGFARARAVTVGCVVGALLPLGALGTFATASAASAAAAAAPTTPGPAVTAAATWLTQQLAEGQGLMPGLTAGVPDVGLTSDTLLSLVAAGQRDEPGFATSLAAVAGHLSGYASFPTGNTTALLAGPLAKTLFLAQVSGADPTSFGGVDLPATVRSLLTPSGANAGRFSDRGTGSDTSNGFSQSFAILGLNRQPGGVPDSAVSFLLAQQCPSGAFRLFYDTPGGCRDNSQADPDATSATIQALTALMTTNPGVSAITTARTSAAQWLAGRQQSDGGLGGAGPTAGENANTTALAAIAYRETGLTSAAGAAQRYVAALQLTGGTDAGAVAYNPAALSPIGRIGSIPSTDEDQWRRSTSQAILAFGLPGYDALATVTGPPITPITSTPSTPNQKTPTSQPSGTPPVQHLPSTPAPVTSSADFGAEQFDPATTDFGSDEVENDTMTDQPADDSDQPSAADSPAPSSPGANPTQPSTATNSTTIPLTHATPQAVVSSKSADGGIPSWVWIIVAAVGGVGGGLVVLRLQAKRARS